MYSEELRMIIPPNMFIQFKVNLVNLCDASIKRSGHKDHCTKFPINNK